MLAYLKIWSLQHPNKSHHTSKWDSISPSENTGINVKVRDGTNINPMDEHNGWNDTILGIPVFLYRSVEHIKEIIQVKNKPNVSYVDDMEWCVWYLILIPPWHPGSHMWDFLTEVLRARDREGCSKTPWSSWWIQKRFPLIFFSNVFVQLMMTFVHL